jgi:hypothetical protein
MDETLDFSSLYPFQLVSGHGGDLKYHFAAYGTLQYHLARLDAPLELLSAKMDSSPAARATAHLCRQVISNCNEIITQRMDLALLTAKGDSALLKYVTESMTDDLDGLHLHSAAMRKYLREYKKKKNVETLKSATKASK